MWDAIGASAELLGALSVIASLLYVGRQFRHSSTTAIQAMNYEMAHLVGDSVENASVMRRGSVDPDTLTEDELFQFSIFLYNQYSYLDFVYVQHEKGLVNPDLFQRAMRVLMFWHPTPGVRAWFEGRVLSFDHKKAFSPEFLTYLDRQFSETPASS
jgi:hypothetical protein